MTAGTAARAQFVPRTAWDPSFPRRHPAFETIAPVAARFADCPDWPELPSWNVCLADLALVSGSGAPLSFVPQLPRGRQPFPAVERYECRVFDRGEVPSRPRCWHDFFNMLCWATFPRTKAALNRRQRAVITRLGLDAVHRLPNARTREQDVLALLDEGGCAVVTEVPLGDALTRGAWQALAHAVHDGVARVVVLGHAVYEHLAAGDTHVRALPIVLRVERMLPTGPACTAHVDDALAGLLDDPRCFLEPPRTLALPMHRALFARHAEGPS